MRWPLRYQILVPFTLVLVAAIVAVSVLSAWMATRRAGRQIEDQLQSIAATLADSTFPLTEAVLEQVQGLSGAAFVFVEADGDMVSSSRAAPFPPRLPEADSGSAEALTLGSRVELAGQRYFPMSLALRQRGLQPPGRLHILYPEQSWLEARNEAALPPLAVGFVALLATVLVSLLIAARLSRPIGELQRRVAQLAEADYRQMPLPDRNDELRDLAVSVNRLAGQLDQMEGAIRRGERLALLGQLAGGLAHNLRNSVTGAKMAVQLHARRCEVDAESLEVALRQLVLTEESLKRFLATPHANASLAAVAQKTTCRLNEIVDEAVSLLVPSLRHRHVELAVAPAATGNPNAAEIILFADPEQLRQMLMNLLLNAADAAGPHGKVRVEYEPRMDRAVAVLRVVDNGPGPPSDIAERLFEPFTTGKPEGVGLGLAVVQQITHSHGGTIEWKRRNGETQFEVSLPLAERCTDTATPVEAG